MKMEASSKFAFFFFLLLVFACNEKDQGEKMNVLFIAVDDLRPEINYYGAAHMYTPNMDRLASEGRVFLNHFVNCAACGPSRSTLLSGKRTLDWDIFSSIRESGQKPDSIFSLPQLFKENGYKTVCVGKISHKPGGVMDSIQTIPEVPYSWDLTYAPVDQWKNPWNAFFSYDDGKYRQYGYGRKNDTGMPPFEERDVDDNGYADGLNAKAAVDQLRALKDTSFFLAVGFYKPHLPFNAPKNYWDLYDESQFQDVSNQTLPKNINSSQLSLHDGHQSYEPRTHYKWPEDTSNYIITPERARVLKHGYCAAVSYVDAQIGKVLEGLKSLGLDKNTIVVLWGDHGWHLGEYSVWGKYTLFDQSLRSPLIVKVPGMEDAGKTSSALVENVDIFPTLADLCGLPIPEYCEGNTMKDIIRHPEHSLKKYVIGERNAWGVHVYTIRDDQYRMVAWRSKSGVLITELYDYSENKLAKDNIAGKNPIVVQSMKEILNRHYDL